MHEIKYSTVCGNSLPIDVLLSFEVCFFPDATPSGDLDEGMDEDNSSVKSIGIFKDKKPKKKKVRKVLSWNF